MQIACAQINPIVGDLAGNSQKILSYAMRAKEKGASLVVFPELALVGYPPQDLLFSPAFLRYCAEELHALADKIEGIVLIVGSVRLNTGALYNTAAVIESGKVATYFDKRKLPNYDVFDEPRYFQVGKQDSCLLEHQEYRLGVSICEDIWHEDLLEEISNEKPDLLVNLSASPFRVGKAKQRLNVLLRASKVINCPVVVCNQVGGADSLIFDGSSMHVGKDGALKQMAEPFCEGLMLVDPKATTIALKDASIADLRQALVLGLRDYFQKQGFTKACFGLSGGIDSAVVACLAQEALGKENCLALCMPSRYSSQGSLQDAYALVDNLGIAARELSIEGPFQAFLDLLEDPQGVTRENLQARIRGMLLMAYSNQSGYIVLSTGNKSELALGYSTLYGDLCGGLAVISDLTKGQVYCLAEHFGTVPRAILEKAPSAELRPNQRDADSLPDYSTVDGVVDLYVEEHLSPEEIAKQMDVPLDVVAGLIKKIHANEYKRRQAPPGLRVTGKAFSVGRRLPIVQKWA